MNVSADIDGKDLDRKNSASKDSGHGALFALVPYWGDDVGMRESFLLAAVYITLASNLNIMIGYTGYINFGNIVFFGIGGYVCVDLVTRWQWPLVAAAFMAG